MTAGKQCQRRQLQKRPSFLQRLLCWSDGDNFHTEKPMPVAAIPICTEGRPKREDKDRPAAEKLSAATAHGAHSSGPDSQDCASDAGTISPGSSSTGVVARVTSSPFVKSPMLPHLASTIPEGDSVLQHKDDVQGQPESVEYPSSPIMHDQGGNRVTSLESEDMSQPARSEECNSASICPEQTMSTQTTSSSGRGGSTALGSSVSNVSRSVREQSGTLSGITGMFAINGSPGAGSTSKSGEDMRSSGSSGSSGLPIAHSNLMAAVGSTQHWVTQSYRDPRGPCWDFKRAKENPVRVLMQIREGPDVVQPVTLILIPCAPPPVAAGDQYHVVLPTDAPRAGVDFAIDAVEHLCFPCNSFIGAGAFAQVHRALYRGMHPVAVKMLTDPGLRSMCSASKEGLSALEGELRIMARLQHPNIVRCYGGNLEGCNPFIVEELCEYSLEKIVDYFKEKHGTGLPLKGVLHKGLDVARALSFLHPSIVHRDLKPQNVLIDCQGVAKVADFGLSRMKMHTMLTTQHSGAGTALYMAPECFSGEGITEKVDVYALGMLLWELLTGERPWKGLNLVQVAFQVAIAGNRPPLPAADPHKCPAKLAKLIDDCWAQNPKDRPTSREVRDLLQQLWDDYVALHGDHC